MRSTQRHRAQLRDDEGALTAAVIGLARSFGRYGYKRITALLQMAGWSVNAKRVQRIWRAEGLKVPKRQPKRGRLWLNDGSCIRLRPEHANHVWAYDFVSETTHDARKLRLLTVVDEYTRECLTIRVERRMTANDVLWVLADLFLEYGIPEHIRSDNGPEFVAMAVREWLADLGVTTLFIEPGSPGRTATSSRSTPSSVMSCSTVSSSTRSRRRRSSSRAGGGSTTACGRTAHWGNVRRRPRRSSGRASRWRTTDPRRSHRR